METKTPQMTPMNSGDTLTTQLPNPYFWQTGPLGSIQIATLLAHARSKNLKRVALITDNSDLGQLLAKFFRGGLEKSGIQVVARRGGAARRDHRRRRRCRRSAPPIPTRCSSRAC